MNDDRFSRYLSERAAAIQVPPGDPAAIVRRADRRRRRRGTAIGVVASLVVALVVVTAVDRGGQDVDVTALGAAAVESPFEWTEVDLAAGRGLGPARSTVAAADGALYSLSTAPGTSAEPTYDPWAPPVLYRSADGVGWEQAALPGDLWTASLAAGGDRLYALGTSPAAVGADVVLASTAGDRWDEATLDLGLTDLYARFGDQIQVSGMEVVEGPAGPVVAIVVRAWPDAEALLPAEVAASGHWMVTSEGIDVLGADACSTPPSTFAPDAAQDHGDEAATGDLQVGADGTPVDPEHPCGPPVVVATYTWADLGVDPGIGTFVEGQVRVAAIEDGQAGDVVELPVTGSLHAMELVAADKGVAVVVGVNDGGQDTQHVFRSTDGSAWETGADPLPGSVRAAGPLGGRLAVVAQDSQAGTAELRIAHAGAWARVELVAPEAGSSVRSWLDDVAFGPLGFAAVRWVPADGDGLVAELVHSVDGTSMSSVPVPGAGGAGWVVGGLAVSADAVTVRLAEAAVEGASEQPQLPAGRLLVGTPAG